MSMTPEQYIDIVDLSNLPRPIVAQDAALDTTAVFDQARDQARVVGSGVFSFATGVDAPVREAVSDSLLLAQLVANKKSAGAGPLDWFVEYASVLQNVGWVTTGAGWTASTALGDGADVHHELLTVLAAALGPAPAALAIVTASVNALRAMNPGSSWIKIFSRESQHASIARFQVGAVEQHGRAVTLSMIACLVEARTTITQVLLFKFRSAEASFKATSPRFSNTDAGLVRIHPRVLEKVQAFQDSFLGGIADL